LIPLDGQVLRKVERCYELKSPLFLFAGIIFYYGEKNQKMCEKVLKAWFFAETCALFRQFFSRTICVLLPKRGWWSLDYSKVQQG